MKKPGLLYILLEKAIVERLAENGRSFSDSKEWRSNEGEITTTGSELFSDFLLKSPAVTFLESQPSKAHPTHRNGSNKKAHTHLGPFYLGFFWLFGFGLEAKKHLNKCFFGF
jgi:hypothetical protein